MGRERELQLLLASVSRPPAVVIVEGEAGVGKSRLVAELSRVPDRPGGPVRIGRCHPQRSPFPLQPILEVLSESAVELRSARLGPVAGALRSLLPELAADLPPVPESSGDPRADAHQVFRAVREALGALGPAVGVLEDLHWADETTVELLHFLVGSMPPGLSLVLTYRGEDLPATSGLRGLSVRVPTTATCATIGLAPLDVAGVADLIGEILEVAQVSAEFASYVHERTGGIPFAVEEVLRLMVDRADIVHEAGSWARRPVERLEVPRAIRDAIVERLAHLSDPAHRLVSAAAVVALPVAEERLSALAGLDAVPAADALSEALESGLLVERQPGRAEFRHALAAQAVYESVPAPQRRRLHARAAELAAADPATPAATVAHHFREAGRVAAWLHHGELAADQAAARYDEVGACRLLLELLAVPSLPPATRVRLAAKLGRLARYALAQREAAAVLRRVLQEADPAPDVRGELRFLLAHLLGDLGDYAGADAEMTGCLPDLQSQPRLAVSAMTTLAFPPQPRRHVRDHLDWLARATATAAESGDPSLQRRVELTGIRVRLWVGEPGATQEALRIQAPTGSIGERRQHAEEVADLLAGAIHVGHYQVAHHLLVVLGDLIEGTEYTWLRHRTLHLRALLDWWTGRWDQLNEETLELKESSRELHQVGHADFGPGDLVLRLLAAARGAAGDLDGDLLEVMGWAKRRGRVPLVVVVAAARAGHRLATAGPDAALEACEEALGSLRSKGIWVWGAELVPAAVETRLGLGRLAEADGLVAEFGAGLEGRDGPAAHAGLLLCQALVAEGRGALEEAAARFEEAERAWAVLPRPYDAALARERLGRVLVELGDAEGVQHLLGALETLAGLGAVRDEGRVRQLLRRRGVHRRTGPPRRQASSGEALSAREREIALLAARGHTSREIAELLFLSPRTVDHHLGRAMRKQGVRTRKALASLLGEEPDGDGR